MPINDGSIVVGIKGDTSDIEQKISELQRKLRSLRETGPGGSISQLAQQYRSQGDFDKAQRLDDMRERSRKLQRQDIARSIKTEENALDKLYKQYQNIDGIIKRRKVSEDAITKAKENQLRLSKQIAEQEQIIGSMKSFRDKAVYGEGLGPFSGREMEFMKRSMGGGRGIGGGVDALGRVVGGMGAGRLMQAGFGAAGAAGAAVEAGGSIYKQLVTYPERLTQREANTAGMLGELSRLQMNRRSYEFSLYGPERLKALETAQTRVGAEKAGDVTSILGRTLIGAGTGALVGNIPGAIIGGLGGFGSAMLDDRKRSMVTDTVGLTKGAYDREMQSVFAGTYQSDLAARKAKNIDLTLSQEFFEKNSNRFRGLQRQFGLSDQELYAGPESIFQRAGRAGYDMDVMTQNMQGIMAAGGTTAVGRAGALTAGKFARNLDVTNAAQVMGRLSGGYGMGEIRSKDEMIRMYAEATRIGLDESEVRNYMQAAADIGFRTGGDQSVIQGALTAGLQSGGVFSGRGIEAAKSAFQRLRDETGTREGLTGQFKLAGLFAEKFNLEESAYLSGLPLDQLSENDPVLKQILADRNKREKEKFEKSGKKGKYQELEIEDLREKILESTFRNKSTIEAMGRFREAKRALGEDFDFSKENIDKIMKGGDIEEKKNVAAYLKSQTEFGKKLALERELPKNLLERLSYIGLKGDILGEKDISKQEAAVRKGLDKESMDAIDKQLRSFAKMDLGNLKLLSDAAKDGTTKLGELTKSFDSVTVETAQYARKMAALAGILEQITVEEIKEKLVGELKRNIGNVTVGGTQERGDYVTTNSEDEFFSSLFGAPGGGSK
jgi:hypothetical protein